MTTKKVVVNRCYGGFSLSPLAEVEIAKRKGIELFFYRQTGYRHRGDEGYARVSVEEATKRPNGGMVYTLTKDFGDTFNSFDGKDKQGAFFSSRDIERHDPDLVAVVESLGKKANGAFAELDVTEIPADVNYTIEEYDGREWVAEAHRTW